MSDPIDYIERTREQYDGLGFPPYKWVHNEDTPPFVPLKKDLSDSKVGLVASGGIYRVGQIAFHYKDDFSFRIINTNTEAEDLRVTHFAYDLRDARQDHNVVFPTGTLKDLEKEGAIGALSENAYTFMGGIYSSRKVADLLATEIADRLVKDEVDVAIMVVEDILMGY